MKNISMIVVPKRDSEINEGGDQKWRTQGARGTGGVQAE